MKFIPVLIFALTLPNLSFANLGDRPLGWSELQSSDFRDYAIRHFNREGELLNNYWLHFWLQQKLIELNFSSPDPIDATTPIMLSSAEVNAFAIPGNIIGINTGLFLEADTEAEFLSVLAHEMAHISLDHFSRLSDGSSTQTWALASGILLTLLFSQENPELANAVLFGTLASTEQSRLNYSRAMELEADQLAQQILAKANYNPEAGRSFFEKLQQFSSDAFEYLRTHPLGNTRSTRLAQAENTTELKTESTIFKLFQGDLSGSAEIKSLDIDTAQTNPNLWLGKLMFDSDYSKSDKQLEQSLNELITLYPSFLPAYASLLKHQLVTDSDNLCQHFNRTSRAFENEFATLDVFEALKNAADLCQHPSAAYWHSQLLWYSGKEEQALAFLANTLKLETQTNEAARLRIRLNQLTQRYERFL